MGTRMLAARTWPSTAPRAPRGSEGAVLLLFPIALLGHGATHHDFYFFYFYFFAFPVKNHNREREGKRRRMENAPAACWGEWNQLISCVSSSPEWGPSSPAPGHGFLHPEPAARNLIQFKGEELVRGSEPGSCPRRDPLGAGAGFASCLLRSRPPPPPSAPNGGGGHSEPCTGGGSPHRQRRAGGFLPRVFFFLGGGGCSCCTQPLLHRRRVPASLPRL